MKPLKSIVVVISCIIALHTETKAQTSITPAEAAKYMGDSVKICDLIVEGKYLREAKDSPTRLYMGSHQPDPLLTIVINKDVLARMGYDPEKKLVNKKVCVVGRITTYKNRPAIILQNPADINDMEEK